MEGVLLMSLYLIIALASWYYPTDDCPKPDESTGGAGNATTSSTSLNATQVAIQIATSAVGSALSAAAAATATTTSSA